MRSISAAAPSRGLPREAGAEERVDDHVRLAEVGLTRLGVDEPHLLACALELPRHDAAVAAVGAAAAHDRPTRRVAELDLRDPSGLRSGPLHQLRRRAGIPGIPRFGGAHLVCGVEGLELSHRSRRRPPARARANASLRDRSRARRAAPPTMRRGPRGERTASGGRRSRCPSTRTRARRRSRAPCPTASLPANRPA